MTTQSLRIHSSKLSEQLARSLEQLILDGVYAVGERLPSERQMAEDFGVSRPSVRGALPCRKGIFSVFLAEWTAPRKLLADIEPRRRISRGDLAPIGFRTLYIGHEASTHPSPLRALARCHRGPSFCGNRV